MAVGSHITLRFVKPKFYSAQATFKGNEAYKLHKWMVNECLHITYKHRYYFVNFDGHERREITWQRKRSWIFLSIFFTTYNVGNNIKLYADKTSNIHLKLKNVLKFKEREWFAIQAFLWMYIRPNFRLSDIRHFVFHSVQPNGFQE